MHFMRPGQIRKEGGKMQRTPIKSSQIVSIGFDPETETMEIEFRGSGNVYRYSNVTPEIHADLVNAESIGKRFHAYIRNNPKHPFTKLETGDGQSKKEKE
jgi:hypothetical protein